MYVLGSNELSVEDEPILTPKTFEEEGKTTIDELKQVNLYTKEYPRLIFINAFFGVE